MAGQAGHSFVVEAVKQLLQSHWGLIGRLTVAAGVGESTGQGAYHELWLGPAYQALLFCRGKQTASATFFEVSLRCAGDGLHRENGVRRSSRTKHKPLDWWRGEHKVYGRTHRSGCCLLQCSVDEMW